MRTSLRNLLLLVAFTIIAILPLAGASASGQVTTSTVGSAVALPDMLDPVPYWLNDEEWVKIVDNVTFHVPSMTEIVDKRILAWYSWLDCFEFDRNCDTALAALVEVQYYTVGGRQRWLVAWVMRPRPSRFPLLPPRIKAYPGWMLASILSVTASVSSPVLLGESDSTLVSNVHEVDTLFFPLRIFDHPTNNNDIYATVASAHGDYREFFETAESRFIDGDVRERTWKAVVGEEPTRFFPNGK